MAKGDYFKGANID